MEQASFGELGENIISLVELAVVGKWPEAETLHAEAMRQVNALKEERAENHSTKIRKMFDDCSCRCGNLLASVLTFTGRWQQAETILREVWLVAKLTLHEGDAEVLRSISNFARVLRRHGNLQEAEKMCREAAQICRRCFPEDHHYTLTSKNNLANVLQKQGKWEEAEKMHREVLEVWCQVLGESHPDTLGSKSNLANVLQEQGKWKEVEEIHREVLEARCQVLGESHPDTLKSKNKLATVLQDQGKWQEAEEMLREVLEARCRVLGESHQDTLSSKNNLADVLQEQGKWQEAEEMHTEVLEAQCRVLGESHQDTLSSRNNLANVLQKQGKWEEAEKMYREVLEVWCQVLGESHPDTLGSRNNLAIVLQQQGKWQEAEKMHREVLEVWCQVLGESHPDTLGGKSNLATVLKAQGKWQEAEEMLREVLEVRCQVLGENHPHSLGSMTSVASVFHNRDKEDWQFRFCMGEAGHADRINYAISTVRKAIDRLQGRVKDDHPSLLQWRFLLAKLLLQMNNANSLQEAEDLLQTLVPALENRYGPNHPDVQSATGHLVFLLEEAGKDAEEWPLHLLGADGAAMVSVEQGLHHSLAGEDEDWEGWEEVTELLRDVLLNPPKPPYRESGQFQKVAGTHSSDPSSSQARLSHRQPDAPSSAASSESASQPSHSVVLKPVSSSRSYESSDATTSSDSLASLRAAVEEKWKERAEREKRPES